MKSKWKLRVALFKLRFKLAKFAKTVKSSLVMIDNLFPLPDGRFILHLQKEDRKMQLLVTKESKGQFKIEAVYEPKLLPMPEKYALLPQVDLFQSLDKLLTTLQKKKEELEARRNESKRS